MNKKDCMQILQLIIAVKREQTFCSVEDSQIFMKNYIHHSSSKKTTEPNMSGSASKTSKTSKTSKASKIQQTDDKTLETEE